MQKKPSGQFGISTESAADTSARRLANLLTPGARLVMSRLKERGVVALSLPEMAGVVKPDVPGLPLPMKDPAVREARWDSTRVTEVLEAADRERARIFTDPPKRRQTPLEQRYLPDGGLLPALESDPRWKDAMTLARAVVTELDALGLIIRVEVRGASVSEKWTLTETGKRVNQHLSIQEWRGEAGKRPPG